MAWSPATPTLPSLHEDHSFRSDQLDSPRRHSFDGGPSPRTWMMVLYAATGIFQPLLVDVIKGRGGAPRNMLLPMLANVLGMALVRPASEALGVATAAEAYGGKSRAWARRPLTVRAVAFATLLDFAAGWLSTLGLLLVGAGGFIIVYAGGAGFTALLSYLFLGRKLDRRQVCGVVAITLGLALNSMISAEFFRGAPSGGSWNGTLIAVAGTVLHSGALVAGERALLLGAPDGLTPWALSSTMGSVEAGALVGYNGLLAALVMGMGALAASVSKEGASLQEVAALYAVLLAINTLHAVAYFSILDKFGSTTAAVIKGVQMVAVTAAASAMFCDMDAVQCLNPVKSVACLFVVVGLGSFASSPNRPRANSGYLPQEAAKSPGGYR